MTCKQSEHVFSELNRNSCMSIFFVIKRSNVNVVRNRNMGLTFTFILLFLDLMTLSYVEGISGNLQSNYSEGHYETEDSHFSTKTSYFRIQNEDTTEIRIEGSCWHQVIKLNMKYKSFATIILYL